MVEPSAIANCDLPCRTMRRADVPARDLLRYEFLPTNTPSGDGVRTEHHEHSAAVSARRPEISSSSAAIASRRCCCLGKQLGVTNRVISASSRRNHENANLTKRLNGHTGISGGRGVEFP